MDGPFKKIYIFQSMTPEVHLSICFHLNQLFTEFGLSGHSKEGSFSDRTSGMTVLNGCLLTTCWERVREQYDKTWMSPSKTMLPTRAGGESKKSTMFFDHFWHLDTLTHDAILEPKQRKYPRLNSKSFEATLTFSKLLDSQLYCQHHPSACLSYSAPRQKLL